LVNQLLKAAAGIDFNTFIDRLAIIGPALLYLTQVDLKDRKLAFI